MNNNDILRRLRYTYRIKDVKLMEIMLWGGIETTQPELEKWLKKEDEQGYVPLYDINLAAFLNGFIIHLRGKKDGENPKPEKSLNNNLILRKLKIALNLKDDDILEVLLLADFRFSKSELAALFRNPSHEKFRVCKDQLLRNFLTGLQIKQTGKKPEEVAPSLPIKK